MNTFHAVINKAKFAYKTEMIFISPNELQNLTQMGCIILYKQQTDRLSDTFLI